jgi:Chitin binding Peritrophin-A domain
MKMKIFIFCAMLALANARKVRILPAQDESYDPYEFCAQYGEVLEYDDYVMIPHETDCNKFYWCYDDGAIYEASCELPDEVFDFDREGCGLPADNFECWLGPTDWNSECPIDTSVITFLPGDTCGDYYLCFNGNPVQFFCRQGEHWNPVSEYCDKPHLANCDVSCLPL